MSTRYIPTVLFAVIAIGFGCTSWGEPEAIEDVLDAEEPIDDETLQRHLDAVTGEDRDRVAALVSEAYLEDEVRHPAPVEALLGWDAEEATSVCIEELTEDHTGHADACATHLAASPRAEITRTLIDRYLDSDDEALRRRIGEGFAEAANHSDLAGLSELLTVDVDDVPIAVPRQACKFIGSLAVDYPDAITEQVRHDLCYARLLVSPIGKTTDVDCGLAVQAVGEPMVPHLLDLVGGEHQEALQLLDSYDNPEEREHFPWVGARTTAVEHLGKMRAEEAVEPLTELLLENHELPELEGERRQAYLQEAARSLNETVLALGDIGDPAARPALEKVLEASLFDDQFSEIISDTVRFLMLQNAARALARIGDRGALAALADAANTEISESAPGMKQQFEQMEEHSASRPPPLVEQLSPRLVAAKSFAYLATANDRGEYTTIVDGFPDDEPVREKLDEFEAAFDVMDRCEDAEPEDERARCFGEFLDDDREHAANKAVLELSRLSPAAAGPVIDAALDTSDLDRREALISAAHRSPADEMVDTIDDILREEQTAGPSYRSVHRQLRMLRARLSQNR